MGEGAKAETLDELSRELKLAFPPGTRLVGVLRDSGMDDSVRAKLEMGGADFPKFLASTSIRVESLVPGAGGRMGPDHDFWDPHRAKGLRTAQVTRSGEESDSRFAATRQQGCLRWGYSAADSNRGRLEYLGDAIR